MKKADLQKRFKQARVALQLSQVDVATVLGKSQRTISNYESGKSEPLPKDIETLEAMLEDKSPTKLVRPESLSLLTDDEFFERLKLWLGEWEKWKDANPKQGDSCDFFFFGPEQLPVFGNEAHPIQRFWTTNLVGKRVNYNVFWILDGCELHDFSSAMLTLRKIDTQARFLSETKPEAKLYVRGVAVSQDSGNKVLSFYQNACGTLEQDHDEKAVLKLEPPHFVQTEPLWNRVLRIGTEIPLMIARIKWSMSASPLVPPPDFSARRFENVSRWIDGKIETGWVFLDKDKTAELVKYIDVITETPAKPIA